MKRVVVAEDNPAMIATLRMVLESWGWEVVVASDGPAAVAAIRAARPDVALIDIGLPMLDGLEVARRVRSEVASTRLVALSGFGEARHRRQSREAGFDQHLVKPVELEPLRAALEAGELDDHRISAPPGSTESAARLGSARR